MAGGRRSHKIVGSYQVQPQSQLLSGCRGQPQQNIQGTPEAVGAHNYKVNYLPLVADAFATNRLFEGAPANVFDNNTLRTDESVGLDTIDSMELSTNFRYGSRALGLTHAQGYRVQHNRQHRQRVSTTEHHRVARLQDRRRRRLLEGNSVPRMTGTSQRRAVWRPEIAFPGHDSPCRSGAGGAHARYRQHVQDQWTIQTYAEPRRKYHQLQQAGTDAGRPVPGAVS